MSNNSTLHIHKFPFNEEILNNPFEQVPYIKDNWPLIYILTGRNEHDEKVAYIGETQDVYKRFAKHLKNDLKSKLTQLFLITCGRFNKSATLDIESNLIQYFSGDKGHKLVNANIGLKNHSYYQKDTVYEPIFRAIWQELMGRKIVLKSLDYIKNRNLFKYSPYKSLSKGQAKSLQRIMKTLLDDSKRNIIVEGGAGTGKTILNIFLFKLMHTDISAFNFASLELDDINFLATVKALKEKFPSPKMALIVPVSSFRGTLKKVFNNIEGLHESMVVAPHEISKQKFDIVLVDEAHRLRRRKLLGSYFNDFDTACALLGFDKESSTELQWLQKEDRTQKLILFYDKFQSVRPSDILPNDFLLLKSYSNSTTITLSHQLRLKGGTKYVSHIHNLLNCTLQPGTAVYASKEYDFLMIDSFRDFVDKIKSRDDEIGLSRLTAGYAWKWHSKKNKNKPDIIIDNISLYWNRTLSDWINSKNAIDEVGCIHTVQGYDLNYAGVIFGKEITYNKDKNEIVIRKENYYDTVGKSGIDNATLKNFIINIYTTLLQRGMNGTYIYVCDKDLADYFAQYIKRADKPVSIPSLHEKNDQFTVPFYNLTAAAGSFSEQQRIKPLGYLPLPKGHSSSKDVFACTVRGESMNQIIPNGATCLFREYKGGSREGKIVLVQYAELQDDFDMGAGYTVKKYESTKRQAEDGQWEHITIKLLPLSNDPSYKPIELSQEDADNVKVIGILEAIYE
ncbi:DNA/RNA helicase domain-containing protein [Chitinophaga sp.]|uniref:DNA/RNA helicase domain-containing protein n=1 Tax=Chitinophaga sp. TaxID=1869181 RepID=UPI0031D7BCE6